MSLEALWTAQFQTVSGWANGGVVVLETNRVFGGDSQYHYLGSFEVEKSKITATIRVTHYFGNVATAWGTDEKQFTVHLEGTISGPRIDGVMFRSEAPNRKMPVVLTHREDLP